MHAVSDYFNLHNEIKYLVAIVEEKSSGRILSEICSFLELDSLVLVSSDEALAEHIQGIVRKKSSRAGCDQTKIQICDFRSLHDGILPNTIEALFFDSATDLDRLFLFSSFQIRYFTGMIKENRLPYFYIWERFRQACGHIYLECADGKTEYVNWDADFDPVELSIVFPVYKVEKYLKQCIESVTKWKADYVEFLFVNDGSPDHSRDIILKYQKEDPRIRLLDKENGGCASARKYGLEHAKGRYVGFVDPDDFVDESMFGTLFARALLGSYEVCYCGYNEYYENTGTFKQVPDTLFSPYSEGTTDPKIIRQLTVFCRVAIWRMIYRRDFLNRYKITFQPQFKRFDDLPFKFEVFCGARSVVSVPQYLYYYRLQRPGQDVSCDDERLNVHFPIFDYLNTVVSEKEDRQLMDYLFVSKLQTHSFAIEKIQRKYLGQYLKKAKKDLRRNVSFFRGLILSRKYMGKSGALQCFLIETRLIVLFRDRTTRRQHSRLDQKNRIRSKLRSLYGHDAQ